MTSERSGEAPFGGLGIWKHSFPVLDDPKDEFEIEVPIRSRVLSAGRQNREVVVWTLGARYGRGPDMSETETLRFRIGTTGNDPRLDSVSALDSNLVRFVGTVQFEEYGLVLHVFQL